MFQFIKGAKEIEDKLKRLPSRLKRRAVNFATKKASVPMVNAAKSNAKSSQDTGALRRNIKANPWRSRIFDSVYSVGVASGKVPDAVTGDGFGIFSSKSRGTKSFSIRKATKREKAGEDPYYKYFVERGFIHKKSGKPVKARPFLEPLNDNRRAKNGAIDIWAQEVDKKIEQFVK